MAFDFQTLLPWLVGAAIALLILFLARRRSHRLPPPVALAKSTTTPDWEDEPIDTFGNRRSSNRREGSPVAVLVTSPTLRGKIERGWVLDRSTGGLRIAMPRAFAVGTVVQIRAENAPDTVPWVNIIIRSCRDEGRHHEMGCSFETTPPWNVLLLFG